MYHNVTYQSGSYRSLPHGGVFLLMSFYVTAVRLKCHHPFTFSLTAAFTFGPQTVVCCLLLIVNTTIVICIIVRNRNCSVEGSVYYLHNNNCYSRVHQTPHLLNFIPIHFTCSGKPALLLNTGRGRHSSC